MNAEDLVAKLTGVQGHGPKWRAICPAHESKHKSRTLSILETPDGRILFKCHAGCSIEQITAAIGVDLEDLFPPRVDDLKRAPAVRKPWSPREVAQALDIPLTSAFLMLCKVGQGAKLSAAERAECVRASEMAAALLHELAV